MKKTNLFLLAVSITVLSCKENGSKNADTVNINTEETAMQQENQEWKTLFDGESLNGWKVYNSSEEPTKWKVENGALAFTPAEGSSGSENLITEEEFTNFELSLEWKISEAGNSGIMWAVQEGEDYNEPYLTGPEIQVLDNQGHPDAQNGPVRQSGALYDMVGPSRDVTNPVGEWNSTVIRIDHKENKGTVTTNGTKITEFPVHGEEWDKMVANSKFADWEQFGKNRTGHIALQDHDDKVWYRNIKIKELE